MSRRPIRVGRHGTAAAGRPLMSTTLAEAVNGSTEKRSVVTRRQVQGFRPPPDGELVAVEVDGIAVAVTVVDGKVHAFDDTCPHAGCSLSDGEVDGHTVECPCHMARFDITTGAVLGGPTRSGISVWSARVTEDALELNHREADSPREGVPRSSRPADPASQSSAADRDITVLIEREHEAFRTQFAALEGLSDPHELAEAWSALTDLLEIHASGEESILYPHLVRAADHGGEETEEAVRDHNEIRDSIRASEAHRTGSDAWWSAVRQTRRVNDEHLREEEQDVLPPFRERVEAAVREELGDQWVAFHAEHVGARGLDDDHADPQEVINRQHEV